MHCATAPPSGARRFRFRARGGGAPAKMADPAEAAEPKQKEKQKNRNKKKAAAGGGAVRVCAGLAAGSPGSLRAEGSLPPAPVAAGLQLRPGLQPGVLAVSQNKRGVRSWAAISCRRRGGVGKAGWFPACGAGWDGGGCWVQGVPCGGAPLLTALWSLASACPLFSCNILSATHVSVVGFLC